MLASGPPQPHVALGHESFAKVELPEFQQHFLDDPFVYQADPLVFRCLQSGKLVEAIPFLERAQQIDPSSYDNGYDLALAEFLAGRLAKATQLVQNLIKVKSTGELHDLLGQIEEKNGNSVAAVKEFEIAAHLDPSEENLFDRS